MTEDALAGLYLQVHDEHPGVSAEEIAQLVVLRLTDEQARDLAVAALANEDTMETTHALALRLVRDYVQSIESGPDDLGPAPT